MKYTLNTYGWSAEFIGKSITKEETEQIENLMKEREVDELSEIRFDIEDNMDFDMWDGDLLHINKSLDNGYTHFELIGEGGEDTVLRFSIDDIKANENTNEYNVFPTKDSDVYFSVDENKGGICSYVFETEDIPNIDDFKYTVGIIETPSDNYWQVIDEILYKGKPLEVYDHLDSNGKSSNLEIFKFPI